MKSVDTQKPLTEEIASPLMSDGKTISVLKCIEPGGPLNHVIPHTGIHHKLSKCQRPLKFHGNIFPAPFLEFRRKMRSFSCASRNCLSRWISWRSILPSSTRSLLLARVSWQFWRIRRRNSKVWRGKHWLIFMKRQRRLNLLFNQAAMIFLNR